MSDLGRRTVAEAVLAGRGVLTTGEARKQGISRATLRWALDRGEVLSLRPGVFISKSQWEAADERDRHLLRLRAALRADPGAMACGTSAAVVWGLPVPEIPEPQLSSAGRSGRRAGTIRRRPAPGLTWLYKGLRVTSAVQTVLDCARLLDPAWGLAVADAAVFKGLVTVPELQATAGVLPAQPGLKRARWVMEHVKPKVESPLESLGRAAIILGGFPEPEPQVWVQTRAGRFRVDMLDEANRVVTEADGKVKYQEAQDVWQEKGRQDHLRDVPLEVVRFTMADHHRQQPWLLAYSRALARAARLG